MMATAASILLLTGSTFLLLAALGIVRMPDLYIRMSSSSKAVTLGIGCLAVGLALHMNDAGVTTRSILLILLFFLKAPVAAHMLGRSAYLTGLPLWEATTIDEVTARAENPPQPTGEPDATEADPTEIPAREER